MAKPNGRPIATRTFLFCPLKMKISATPPEKPWPAARPCVLTDRCGIAPLVQDRAGLVAVFDRAAFGKALAQLLDDDELRNRLRAGCAEVARALTWDEPLDQMESLYSAAIAGAPRA
jgi:hypothetical protein